MVVLFVGVAGTLGAISSFVVLGDSSRDTTVAYLRAERVIEQLKAANFDEVFARFNDDAGDDPAGVSPGADFAVAGLDPRDDDADGIVGRILFPVGAGAPSLLREDLVDEAFGMPRDLNADGVVDAVDHSGDYVILPVRVRVEWRGRSGNRFIELETILVGR